jgi:CheY-like chemotaxis protein
MPKRVLIIDDEADICTVVQVALEELAGWQTVAAGSGAEGLRLAQTTAVDAILLDISMPDMDGFAIHQALRQAPSTQGIPVVVFTSKVLARDRARFATLNIAGVITKPFNPLTLAQQIAALLQWSPPTRP